MFDPLQIAHNNTLYVQLQIDMEERLFQCIDYRLVESTASNMIARYTLDEIEGYERIVLEVVKDKHNNFQIQAYQMLEEYPFSAAFAAMLGTPMITFTPADTPLHQQDVYKRVLAPDEKIEIVKYICEPNELPAHPKLLGYTKDAHGHWYQLIEQSQGRIKPLTKTNYLRCWEYESEDFTRLLIEREESQSYKADSFQIYLGQKLSRKDIHIVHAPQAKALMQTA